MVYIPSIELKKYGNSYYLRVPKKLIDSKIMKIKAKYDILASEC